MLTGDKVETAACIARSSSLVPLSYDFVEISESKFAVWLEEKEKQMKKLLSILILPFSLCCSPGKTSQFRLGLPPRQKIFLCTARPHFLAKMPRKGIDI